MSGQITTEECRTAARKLRELAEEQPWAAVSHRQNASWWDGAAKRAAERAEQQR